VYELAEELFVFVDFFYFYFFEGFEGFLVLEFVPEVVGFCEVEEGLYFFCYCWVFDCFLYFFQDCYCGGVLGFVEELDGCFYFLFCCCEVWVDWDYLFCSGLDYSAYSFSCYVA